MLESLQSGAGPRVARGIRRPDLDAPRSGTRYLRVPGGLALAFDAGPGDRFEVTDVEGRQRAMIACFAPDGAADPARLDHAEPSAVTAGDIGDFVAAAGPALSDLLRSRGLDLAQASPHQGLGGASRAGERLSFAVKDPAIIVVAAPGRLSGVEDTDAPGDLQVALHRLENRDREPEPPPPLAEPLADFMVARRTGLAYEVKAGEFIQVLDIMGRQCSDFLAFPRRALDRGLERFVDSTVTRTMVGHAYPRPGLFDKFYDQDNQPLVQLVQDTCGRHDTFGLACTARVYALKGFPGHVNCSDNISAVMAPYGVARRAAWPAVNFFFNTAVEQGNAIASGEGWSRPGDYVLMKALTDLVCVSTACPDDTSPINGWAPTDVQVRTYGETEMFKRSVAFRARPEDDARLTRETGFHPRTSALTRDFRVAKDYWIPGSYTGVGTIREYWACREAATIQDMSQLRKIDVTGPDAETLMDLALPRDAGRIAVGQIVYSPICREHGGMFDDGTLFRLSPDAFRWMCGDDLSADWLRKLAAEKGLDAWVRTASDHLHNLAVQGPSSRDILEPLVWSPEHQPRLAELKRFRFLVGRLGGFDGPAILVSRTGFTGGPGYEVFCAPADAPAVWDAIWQAGRPQGLEPMGLDALDTLRIEAGLPVAGQEFGDDIDPFEAGVGFAVKLEQKPRDFIGRTALERNAGAPRRRLVGLALETKEVPRHGEPVFVGRDRVGVVTSAARSPRLGHSIALARVAIEVSAAETELEIGQLDGSQKRLIAKVTAPPFAA